MLATPLRRRLALQPNALEGKVEMTWIARVKMHFTCASQRLHEPRSRVHRA